MTRLHRLCPERNMARFYAMSIERSLFGHFVLTRNWGRIGASGQTLSEWFEEEAAANHRREQLIRLKRRRGYNEPDDGAAGQLGRE